MGAWIEIIARQADTKTNSVAPHMGAWIEIITRWFCENLGVSHPTWVRGLKSNLSQKKVSN